MAKKLGRLANRYAKALRQAVLEELGDNGSPTPSENCADSLEGFAKLWQSKELEQALLNPMFSKEDRIGAVTAFAQQLDAPDIVRRFLNVLVERGRLFGIVQIAEAFRDLINESKGAVQVSIETARDVADSERAEVQAMLKKKIKGEPEFSWSVDTKLIGGMVVRYQGNVLDGSVLGRLERLEGQLQRVS